MNIFKGMRRTRLCCFSEHPRHASTTRVCEGNQLKLICRTLVYVNDIYKGMRKNCIYAVFPNIPLNIPSKLDPSFIIGAKVFNIPIKDFCVSINCFVSLLIAVI